ncbi:MAG: MlaD family protein [Candidatus Binatia bacterium]
MKTTRATQIRVGLLILVSLTALGGTIFMLGKERRLFEHRVDFEIRFSRTNGLKEGAPVSFSGVTVGSVQSMTFPQDVRQNYIVVRIRVAGAVASRIRRDAVARIRTLGILGDKFIELSGGSAEREPLPPGGLISSINPIDYEALLGEGGDVVQNFIEATSSLKAILRSVEEGKGLLGELLVSDEAGRWGETLNNLRAASASLRNILGSVERGEGVLGQLVRGGDAGRRMVRDLEIGLKQLRRATRSFQEIAEKLERGEGTLGMLIQDPAAGNEILTSLQRSASNLEALTRQIREGGGILQRLVSDRSYAERVLGHLEQTTEDLALITAKIERGDGTIGALINDPELYQEAKGIIANAKGSWLYSLYRFFQNISSSGENQATEGTGAERE